MSILAYTSDVANRIAGSAAGRAEASCSLKTRKSRSLGYITANFAGSYSFAGWSGQTHSTPKHNGQVFVTAVGTQVFTCTDPSLETNWTRTSPGGTINGHPYYIGVDYWTKTIIVQESSHATTSLRRSADNGLTWQSITVPLAARWTLCGYKGYWIAVSTYTNATATMRSEDDGITWVQGPNITNSGTSEYTTILATDSGIFCVSLNSATSIYKISSGATGWTSVAASANTLDYFEADNRVIGCVQTAALNYLSTSTLLNSEGNLVQLTGNGAMGIGCRIPRGMGQLGSDASLTKLSLWFPNWKELKSGDSSAGLRNACAFNGWYVMGVSTFGMATKRYTIPTVEILT